MRLFEAILQANHRALAGDAAAGVHPSDYPDALPVVALTCIDPRLNHLLPDVLGVRDEDFIWLRNAGNIVFDPLGGIMRSLALACAIKGGREIAIVGHTDCRVRQVSASQLLDSFRALGISRSNLPDNLVEYFGLFASERQNVISGVSHIRRSPLISPGIPVHGLLVDIDSGRLEWLVNGYEQLGAAATTPPPLVQKLEKAEQVIGVLKQLATGELKVPEIKIGDFAINPQQWLAEVKTTTPDAARERTTAQPQAPSAAEPTTPPLIPIPPPLRFVKKFVGPKK